MIRKAPDIYHPALFRKCLLAPAVDTGYYEGMSSLVASVVLHSFAQARWSVEVRSVPYSPRKPPDTFITSCLSFHVILRSY